MKKEETFYTAKYDLMFKCIFCKESNRDLLKYLLEKCLKKEVKIIKVYSPEIIKDSIYEKGKTLDVLIEAEGEEINIEMNSGYYGYLHRRNASYIFTKYSKGVDIGESYKKMKNYIQINFTCGLGNTRELIEIYKLCNPTTQREFIDNLTIYEYNVDRIKKEAEKEYKYIAMLDSDKKKLDKICIGDEKMEKFKEEVEKLNKDEKVVEFLSAEKEAELLRNTLMEEAIDTGLKQGFEQGIQEGIQAGMKQGM